MLFPKSLEPLDDELFSNPTNEYRGVPFWAWNCQMTTEKIAMIVENLKDMGMGGGHIHCRTGMSIPYMGNEFLHLVNDTHKKFADRNMYTWLYDEDRWPSGTGGGFVTKEEQYRVRFLVFSPEPSILVENMRVSSGVITRSENRRLLARYQIYLEDGWLKDYKILDEKEKVSEGYSEWFAYLEISGDNPWFNNQSYVNTLDKNAIDRFIEVTHEKYKNILGEKFGDSVPAIFTDEPRFSPKKRFHFAKDKTEVIIPYTDDLEDSFQKSYGHSLLESLPELFWERKTEMVSRTRYEYHDHVCERFVNAFADNIGKWCKDNNILLTGHMMEEPTLESQTGALGEAMRSYRSFGLPGVDMLCDHREFATVKQAQSASHQYGCPGVLSELYGVTNWDFDFRGHKQQGDWQAALGVTIRVPHLTWTSMAGEAKRDFPASIGYQSPWFKEYKFVEDYFSRINTLLTRGKPDVRIGVIHPIESYWLYWGTEEKTGLIREDMEENFDNLVKWLLLGMLDFDFICESLLPELSDYSGLSPTSVTIGEMNYHVILVPNCVTLRKSTLDYLKKWHSIGGKVIFTGEIPTYVDAFPSVEVKKFAEQCHYIPFIKNKLLFALEEERTIDVRDESGKRTDNLIYQMRKDGENKILFLAHAEKMKNKDLPLKKELVISIQGTYKVLCYEPVNGTKKKLPAEYKDGTTILKRIMYDHDSLLLYLIAFERDNTLFEKQTEYCRNEVKNPILKVEEVSISREVPVILSEPNVLVLDMAEYSFDKGKWMEKEELLRIDNKFRRILKYPVRMEVLAQPWLSQTSEESEHILSLRFYIESELDVNNTLLALENENTSVILNGELVPEIYEGWYADKDIKCRKLGTIHRGMNELVIEIPYSQKENIENLFLLGDFGVKVTGCKCVLTRPVRKLCFGDYTSQGLPFYGGNVTYCVPVTTQSDCIFQIEVSKFRNPLIKVSLDDTTENVIAYSPYRVEIACLKGSHILKFTAFGNRVNTFGTLHNCNETETWYGPNAWRTEEEQWAYEYQIKATGILKSPIVKCLFK